MVIHLFYESGFIFLYEALLFVRLKFYYHLLGDNLSQYMDIIDVVYVQLILGVQVQLFL